MESNQDKFIRGTFEVVDEKLSFTCSTKGVSFEEVKIALTKLRDECQRQLYNETKCPYYKMNAVNINLDKTDGRE